MEEEEEEEEKEREKEEEKEKEEGGGGGGGGGGGEGEGGGEVGEVGGGDVVGVLLVSFKTRIQNETPSSAMKTMWGRPHRGEGWSGCSSPWWR